MTARLFSIVRRRLPAHPPARELHEVPPPGQHHGRQVKQFIADYTALQDLCASAQSRNHRETMVDLIDQMRRMEQRIRFVVGVAR